MEGGSEAVLPCVEGGPVGLLVRLACSLCALAARRAERELAVARKLLYDVYSVASQALEGLVLEAVEAGGVRCLAPVLPGCSASLRVEEGALVMEADCGPSLSYRCAVGL